MNRKIFLVILMVTGLTMALIFYGMINVYQYAPNEAEESLQGSEKEDQNQRQAKENETEESSEPQEESAGTFHILIAGDSIARGRGDQDQKGLVKAFPEDLNGGELKVTNAGMDGLVSSELPEVMANPALSESIKDVDLFIISIGGNDLRRIAAGAFSGEMVDSSSAEYQDALFDYLENLQKVMTAIRSENQSAKIVVLGLFNPFQAEELRGFIPRDIQLDILFQWNFETKQLVEQDELAVVVPMYDLFKWNIEDFLSFDFIHPNDLGYQMISERILAVLQLP